MSANDLNRITLADLLAEHIGETDDYPDGRALGEHLLESVEMQAIRKALRNMYDTRVRECGYGAAHEWLRALNLPLSVIAWVLEGEQ
ncbi:MAG: hypothetical protein IT456_25550 [Planctomycetes bacterium]|nr:hypothetical protein [Planctomycetota bacterium]